MSMKSLGGFARAAILASALVGAAGLPMTVLAQPGERDASGLKSFADVSKDFEKVVSTADGKSFYNLWTRQKDGAMIAELPRGYEGQRHFIAMTVASGETYAGLQAGDRYVYWKRQDNRLLLLEPQVGTRSTGDQESKSSVERLFTDRVILDLPILAMGPSNQPVIDMKDLLTARAGEFFGRAAAGANARLATLKVAKAFPENIEIRYEMPTAGGILKQFHYSISRIPDNTGYKPREADSRVGYFTTVYRDLGKFTDQEKWVRYINRWHVEKRDPKLKLSPPKEPIVFYIEHTVPVRYRRFVQDGVLEWNKAFEKIGIVDAIQVYQQDEATGANMDKDPEDVRYNFIRWLSNDIGTAIGPSRTHPLTGQILDADVILTDGWIRHFWVQFAEILPELAMEGFSPETMAWLETNPQWDPRVRLADPAKRNLLLAQRARRGITAYGGHPIAAMDPRFGGDEPDLLGTHEYDGFAGRTSQAAGLCLAAKGKAFDVAMMRMTLDMLDDEAFDALAAARGEEGGSFDTLDGVPDWFIGPLLMDLVAHEVGHTLGLRHNFRASTIYDLSQINSDEVKGKKPFTGSVMDYTPINMAIVDGKPVGDFGMNGVGAYDFWAIEYGYGSGDLKEVLKRVNEPELIYGTDEDTMGPDPRDRRYDFAKNPLDYAKSQMELARYHRDRLLDKFVKDGDSWSRARRGYTITLGMQTRSLSMMSNWIGGAYVSRSKKGDPNAGATIEPVPADQQRDALRWIVDNSFFDEAWGLSPELLSRMTVDKRLDEGGFREAMEDPTWPIHDRIAGIQSSVLTMLMNPTTVRRVYDNEMLIPADQDALTLPEMLDTINNAVWSELEKAPSRRYTARQPMISSLRRNLQREHLDRLIDLALGQGASNASGKPVANLAVLKLRQLDEKLAGLVEKPSGNLDAYTLAHLTEAHHRIQKVLDANYTYNAGGMGGGFPTWMLMGQPTPEKPVRGVPDYPDSELAK
mgnify:CR=1 FL=1